MGMHASLIWPSVIVLALLGHGWNACSHASGGQSCHLHLRDS